MFTSPNTTTVPGNLPSNHHCPLLYTLPLELRLHIYSYLLPTPLSPSSPSSPSTSIHINHCTHLTQFRLPRSRDQAASSPLSRYLKSRRLLTQWSRSHGFHLTRVCRQLRDEICQVISQRNVRIEGHCITCLGRGMGILKEETSKSTSTHRSMPLRTNTGSSVNSGIPREWWLRISVDSQGRASGETRFGHDIVAWVEGLRGEVGRRFGGVGVLDAALLRAEEARTSRLRRMYGGAWGPVDAHGRSTDDIDANCRFWYLQGNEDGEGKRDRLFVVEYVRIIGRELTGRKRKRRRMRLVADAHGVLDTDNDEMDVDGVDDLHEKEEEDDDNEDEDADADDYEDDNPLTTTNTTTTATTATPTAPAPPSIGRYIHNDTIIETKRQTRHYYIDRPGKLEKVRELDRFMHTNIFTGEGDTSGWWRASGSLNRERGIGRRDIWFVREEIWVGCRLR